MKPKIKSYEITLNFGVAGEWPALIYYIRDYNNNIVIQSVSVAFDGRNEIDLLGTLDDLILSDLKTKINNYEADQLDQNDPSDLQYELHRDSLGDDCC